MSFDDSGFTSAKLDTSEDSGFDAGRYAFFGNFGDDVGALDDTAPLEGALEEGLEAPPEEELAAPYEMLDADEDLGYASMFAAALGKGKEPSLRSPTATDAAGSLELSEPTPPPPPKPKLGSIALGGLLAASTPTESAFSGMPSSSPSSFAGFGASQHPNNPLGLPFGLATTKSQQQQPSVPPKALTSEELEAQLRGAAAPAPPQGAGESSAMGTTSMYAGFSQQQQPQQQSAPLYMPPGYNGPPSQPPPGMSSFFPPTQPPPTMQTHPGVFTPEMIMQQQLNQQQQQQRNGPARPPGPPSHFMPPGMMPPPPPSGASGMLPFGHPPSGPHPGPPLPPPPQHHHAPGAAHHPGMMMMMPPPPHHHHHRPHAPRPPPPALGAGPPRPPQPGFYGHGGPRPPMGGGGGRPSGHPHPTLAQRLRALNLADRPDFARGPTLRRRIHSSQYMDSEEIESILSMQWRSLYQGNPYIEDHYYQAFVFKHYGRRNRRTFAPESVRELAPTEKMAPDQVAFVKLEGLGRVAFSNIRRPRPLMDVSPEDLRAAAAAALQEADAQDTASHGNGTTPAADAAASLHPSSGAQPTRRLGQEPMLAARIMLEDCMALILDVQDIDRIFVAGTGGRIENEAALLQRRTLLMDGLAASLRLPEHAVASARKDAGAPSDGVFLRLLTLPKGKTLAARALQQLYPPSEIMDRSGTSKMEPNLRILWAVLRNARALFGGAPMPAVAGGKAAIEAALGTASKVAEAASDVIKRLHSPQAVCDALSAVTHGDLIPSSEALENDPELVLLPLFAPGDSSSETRYRWLSDVLRALLQRGAEFELSSGAKNNVQGGEQAVESWLEEFPKLYGVVSGHVLALSGAAVAAKEEGDRDGVEELKRMVPVGLVRSFLPHCGKEQGDELRSALTSMGL